MPLYLNDKLNFIRKASLKKVANLFSIYFSFYKAVYTRQVNIQGLPFSMAIEPTTSCNLRCPECPSGLRSFTRPTGMLSKQLFEKIIQENQKHLWYLTFYFQGEPFLHPEFLEMVKFANDKGIYTATSTNAHFLDDENARKTVESGLDRIIISIDGATQDTYAAYRKGGQLNKVLEGTKNLIKWKKALKRKTPHTIFQFLVVRPNEHEIEEIKKSANEIGVDEIKFKTAQIYDYKNGNPLIPNNSAYSRYKKMPDGTYRLNNKMDNHCWKLWHSCVITWNGKVVPCCFDKDANHPMGDLNHQTFAEIWKNENYQKFRNALWKSRQKIDICRNCTEGTKVWT